jgi:arylsulfatase A-like enzyme
MRAFTRTLAWFVGASLLWGGIDLLQVGYSTGGQPLGALTAVVLALYFGVGVLASVCVAALLSRTRGGGRGIVVAAATLLPGAALAAAYANFVHLPDFLSPLTLTANLTLAAFATASVAIVARAAFASRIADSVALPIALAVLGIACAGVAARGWAHPTQTEPLVSADDRPNVFVITIDSLRADRVRPSVPRATERTPNLAALGARGVTFTHAYSQASWTKPSVASLLTSLFPSTHGANLRRDRLSSQATTLAETFARHGYRTAVFSANPWISPAFGFDRGVEHFFETEQETFSRMVLLIRVLRALDRPLPSRPISRTISSAERAAGLGVGRRSNCERDNAILGALASWLSQPAHRPVFAYLHLMSPHIPYEPPSGTDGFDSAEQVDLLMRTAPLEEGRREALIRLYDETVAHADSVLGEILDAVASSIPMDRTIIVTTADHGEEFFEHGRFGHGKTLYEEVVHVPLVMAGPGLPAGITRDDPAMLVDIAPTLAKLVGIASSASWAGRNLVVRQSGVAAYAELLREGGLELYMTSDGRRKYVETIETLGAEMRAELYDLRSDPGEKRPLQPPTSEPLRAEMTRLRDAARRAALAREATAIDENAEERLRALGYVN